MPYISHVVYSLILQLLYGGSSKDMAQRYSEHERILRSDVQKRLNFDYQSI